MVLVRKTVTVLFSDVVTSTELGERLDPESLRRVMTRYFDEMRAVVERHGGTVEKFIGDEVMAVFGVPSVHEDDALRAVRAAAEMRERLGELNAELEKTWGVRLEARTGINTGEVVAGEPSEEGTFVTGDPVVLAKRLEQAAAAGEILIGKATYPLVRDAVKAGPLESFPVKGKAQEVAPWRLDDVEADAPGLIRRLDAPLVDRTAELARLQEAHDVAVRDHACRLFTIFGSAGIGKSRLALELRETIGAETRWLTGRCLPYGEGITFFPLAEIVREAGGHDEIAWALRGREDADTVSELIRGATGHSPAAGGSEETFWAVRRMLEALAAARPLVVCLEDIHWAEPTFLDLIEYLAGWVRSVPILLLCLARPELLELQPAWTSPKPNAGYLVLEPLSEPEAEELLDALRGDAVLSEQVRSRITVASEGNPLFVEQMAAMAAENGEPNGELAIPPSIQALLAERLDRLGPAERAVIERASVIGKEFPRRAVVELCPPGLRDEAGRHLMALVRKELIRPDLSGALRDDGFRFRHMLIRDAAYDALPKEVRSDLHERVASWVQAQPWAGEVEEIMGYHLEQSFRYREQLGPTDAAAEEIGARAAAQLGKAGRLALARGDARAAAKLLQRAAGLPSRDPAQLLEWKLDLAAALRESGDLGQAADVLEKTIRIAAASGDARLEARGLVERAFLQIHTDPDRASEAGAVARKAVGALEAADDEFGLARAWTLAVVFDYIAGRITTMEAALTQALRHAERAGVERNLSTLFIARARAALIGPTPAPEAIARCRKLIAERPADRTLEAVVLGVLAPLEAMTGRFDEARELYGRSIAMLTDLGRVSLAGSTRTYSATVELLADAPEAAERELRSAYADLEAIGDRGNLATVAAILGEALLLQGRREEALDYTVKSEEVSFAEDVMPRVSWRATRARILAERGDLETALRLSEQAIELAAETDYVTLQGDALLAYGQVLRAASDEDRARAAIAEAVQRYTAKGDRPSAARAQAVLEGR